MSSSFQRDPLDGVIRQDRKIVGAICLPEDATQEFIDEFNHCYGPLNLQIEPPVFLPLRIKTLVPVGARRPRTSPNQPNEKRD